ncbi:MAG TPA: flavin reductase family protein [Steroidobacter sp.]|uniref:flavin reductase family protein n=1 Tax=Steroidobacter sp. TaxID=1978227 RepID=UPI002ED9C5F5
MNQGELRRAFGLFATGVTVVTGMNAQGQPVGVTANSMTSVSLDPPLLLWCLANKSGSLGAFALDSPFAVHVLSESQADVALHFARSGSNKFAADVARDETKPPVIDAALARITCRVVALHAAGDHTIILGQVDAVESRNTPPLLFHASRFGRFSPAQDEPWSLLVDMWS